MALDIFLGLFKICKCKLMQELNNIIKYKGNTLIDFEDNHKI